MEFAYHRRLKGTISGPLTSPLVMTFDSTFPQVQNVQVSDQVNGQAITQSYYAQMTTRGTIGLTGIVSSSKGISKIESVENSPLSGSTTLYNTANSYATTVASNGSYWSSTVTPPATQSNVTFASGNPYRVMITATGSNSALWTAAGAPATVPGTVWTPNNVTLNVSASGGAAFIESDASGNFDYSLSMTINSSVLYNNTTGQYVFNIRATDMTSPTAEVTNQPITLDEDNYYPTSTLSNPSVVAAGNFQVGARYTILSQGSGTLTDFTTIGSPSNSVGQTFVATGAGSGSGTGDSRNDRHEL